MRVNSQLNQSNVNEMRKFFYCRNCPQLNAVNSGETEHTCIGCGYTDKACNINEYEPLISEAERYAIFEVNMMSEFDYSDFGYDDVITNSGGDYVASGGELVDVMREFVRMANDADLYVDDCYYIVLDCIDEKIVMS